MTTLQPTFDPKTETWFIDQFEAPTLRELLILLPPKTKLQDYFPQGYNAVRLGSATGRVYMPTKSSFNMQNSKVKPPTLPVAPKPTVPTTPTTNDDAILDDWFAGMSGDAIANKHNILTQRVVMKKIKAARNRGDPRAIPHQKSFETRPHRYDHEKILTLWAQGLTGPEIGKQLGLHASTTAAAIVAEYRKRGDPRALPRAPSTRQCTPLPTEPEGGNRE